jgi:serine protease
MSIFSPHEGKLHLLALVLGLIVASQAAARESYPTDRLVVKYRNAPSGLMQTSAAPTLSAAALDALSSRIGVRLQAVRRTATGANVLRLPRRMNYADVRAYAQKLRADPNVLYAEPDGVRKVAMAAPTDSLWSSQYDLQNRVGGIDMLDAWDYTTGSASINVAVLDTGILNHPDLKGRIVPGYDFVSDLSISNDGDGRDPDPTDPGDWVAAGECGAGTPAEDSSWHGTHIAGTIAAVPNNNMGIAGINWKSGLLPVRVLGKCGGYDSDVADGMLWSIGLPVAGVPNNTHPARVINLSLGGPGACTQVLQDAINQVVANKGVVVVAAGNDGGDATQSAPGNCANVITVGAIGPTGALAYYSNTGRNVALMAPGGDTGAELYSTWNDGTTTAGNMVYGAMAGTSMATPHVAGVVSLMLSVNPALTYSSIVSKLKASVSAFPAGSGCTTTTCGAGILNAANALRSVSAMTVSAGTNQTVSAGNAVTLAGSASYGAVAATTGISYLWTQTGGPAVTLASANTAKATFTAPATSTTLGFKLTGTDAYGNTGSSNVTVTVINGLPMLTVPGTQDVVAGSTESFTVSATGNATLSAANLPAGASFNATTGQFSWPSAGPVGTYTVNFTATNAQGAATSSVTINVNQQLSTNSTPSSGSGKGGGCVLGPSAPFDPLLPGLLLVALLMRSRHRIRGRRR